MFINEGKLPENAIPQILQSLDRTKAGRTVPPQGLYLNKVFYPSISKEECLQQQADLK